MITNKIPKESMMENIEKENETKNNKRILKLILGIGLIVVLVAVTVFNLVGMFVEKDNNFNFENPTIIKVRNSTSGNALVPTFQNGDSEYEEIMKLYNDSFKTKLLTALFGGNVGNKIEVNEEKVYFSNLNGLYLEFFYNNLQELYVNGEKFESTKISDESYNTVWIQVENADTLTKITAHIKYRHNDSSNYSYISFSTYARQSNLYQYLQDLLD